MLPRPRTGRTLAEVGEFGFLSRLLPQLGTASGVIVGPGQDCAVIRCSGHRQLYTIDVLVEGVHFEAGWMTPHQLGRKSFLINASDVAAMGGQPRFCVVSAGVPPSYPARDLAALHAGIAAAARASGAVVVGGNLTRAAQLFVSIALLADAPTRIVTRQGARAGDRIYVTGTLGDAALGVRLLRARRSDRSTALPIRRFREPSVRLQAGRWLAESGIVSAMIDVSDGLIQDLGHICEESGVGAFVRTAQVPLSRAYQTLCGSSDRLALHGGEDYELLCTVPEHKVKALERSQRHLGCAITCIGEIAPRRGVRLIDAAGQTMKLKVTGHDHFRGRS